jgi:hypothetical protein
MNGREAGPSVPDSEPRTHGMAAGRLLCSTVEEEENIMQFNKFADQARFVPPEHADTTARVHGILAVLYLIVVAVIMAVAVFGTGASEAAGLGGVALFVLVPCLVHVALCYGASRRLHWAKNGSRAVGVLMLLGFPIGTAIGVLLLVKASKPWPTPMAKV